MTLYATAHNSLEIEKQILSMLYHFKTVGEAVSNLSQGENVFVIEIEVHEMEIP